MSDHRPSSLPTSRTGDDGWVVVVLSCGPLGFEVAERVLRLPGVDEAHVFTAPWPQRRTGICQRLWRSIYYDGPAATVRAIFRRIAGFLEIGGGPSREGTNSLQDPGQLLSPGVRHIHVENLDSADTRHRLKALAADVGILAGTYILPPRVFEIPRLGMINLHSGKVPEYRGSSPGFWELYNGEREVGITVHEVIKEVDAGRVLRAESFPLDPAPGGDAIDYLERYRGEVLQPNGVRMLVEAVNDLVQGETHPEPQKPGGPPPWPIPGYRAVRELRRRVRDRRSSRP